MDLHEIMSTNGTCRYFKPDALADEVLLEVLSAARWAPSGGNRQPVTFVAVQDEGKKAKLKDLYLPIWNEYMESVQAGSQRIGARPKVLEDADHFANHLELIPVHLVVCADLSGVHPTDLELDRLSVVGGASIYPAVQNVLLAARARGLGAALTTLHASVEPQVKSLLQIPAELAVVAVVMLGWPAKAFPKKLTRRPVEEIAFKDTYGHQI
ncbi:MAG: nitroreductase family protein [Pseudomonadota bacterium]